MSSLTGKEKIEVFVVCKITGALLPHSRDRSLFEAADIAEDLECRGEIVALKQTGLPDDTRLHYISWSAGRYKATCPLLRRAERSATGMDGTRSVILAGVR